MEALSQRLKREQSGFTLVELLTASVIMIVVLGAILVVLQIAVRAEPEIRDRNAKVQDAQIELERLTREIRQSYGVVSAGPSSLTVFTYLNRSTCGGTATDTTIQCRVSYSCSGGTCTRVASNPDGGSPGASTVIVSGITSDDIFTYSPNSSSPTVVDITLEYPREEGSSEDAITVSDGVVLRNVPAEDSA